MPWASPLSLQVWDGINQCERLLRVVTIGSGQLNGERNSPCVADQMTFAAQLGPVSRVPSAAPKNCPDRTQNDDEYSPNTAFFTGGPL